MDHGNGVSLGFPYVFGSPKWRGRVRGLVLAWAGLHRTAANTSWHGSASKSHFGASEPE